jgi:sulfite reductase subunit B
VSCNCQSNKDLYLPEAANVLASEPMTKLERFFEFQFDGGKPLGHEPGQFVEVSIPGIGEAPISVSSSPTLNDRFQLVVRNVGNVSSHMHKLEAGQQVGIRGPFGTSFPVEGAMKGKDLLFVCGGIGLVPVRSAIDYVLANRENYGKVTILFGARTPADRLFAGQLSDWTGRDDVVFHETVDKGDADWKGNVGVITTLMPKVDVDPDNTVAIVCGPPVMYKFVLLELAKKNMHHDNVYVSLERRMKCGVGKCGHCQINGIYVCQDGPVFKFSDVANVEEAIQ